MRKLSLVLVPLALCPFTAASQTVAETASPQRPVFETPLPTGTALRLQLRDGDFRVVGTIADKISIHAAGKKLAQSGNIKVQVQQFDHAIELRLSHVPKNELQVTIEIPRSTNLYARMRGGDLSVSAITGDKDLELTGGDLTVEVGNPEDYAHVDLSVRYGDISGTPFGEPQGTLGNSLRKDGNGKYRLHAHVMAGDLVLKS